MRAFYIFVLALLLTPISRGQASGSVFFIDDHNNHYIRQRSSSNVDEALPMSSAEISATVSVLLGLTPPATLTADGSSKLNRILKPNPFERPRKVFMLEISGADDALVEAYSGQSLLGSAIRSNVVSDSYKADIKLPDESEVAVVSLDENLSGVSDKDINDLASWIGGSYVADPTEPLAGVLSIPTSNNAKVELLLEKEGQKRFVLNLLVLSRNIRQAIDLHELVLPGLKRPAEFMLGRFSGINDLKEESGESKAKEGMEVLLVTLSRLFELLQTSHQGQIVGVMAFESEKLLNVVYKSGSSAARVLAEGKEASSPLIIVAEVLLVRLTLAWLTAIILLIATLLGVYFMVNMPLTRDTLLYSNVKLD